MESARIYKEIHTSTDSLDNLENPIDDESQNPEHNSSARRSTLSRLLSIIARVAIAGIVTVVFIGSIGSILTLWHDHGNAAASPATLAGCGNSTHEARSQGCVFDVMMQLWVPQPCYNRELSEEFLAEGQWKWYRDPEAEQEMPDEEMRRGEHTVAFVVDGYHRQHCVFTWQLMVYALREQQDLSTEMMSYHHVEHCHMILMAPEMNATKLGVQAYTGFSECAPYETWKNNLDTVG